MATSSTGGKILSTEKEIVEAFNIPQLHSGSVQMTFLGNFGTAHAWQLKILALLPVTLKPAPKFEKLGLAAALLQQCPTSTSESEFLAFSSIGIELYLV